MDARDPQPGSPQRRIINSIERHMRARRAAGERHQDRPADDDETPTPRRLRRRCAIFVRPRRRATPKPPRPRHTARNIAPRSIRQIFGQQTGVDRLAAHAR